MINMKTKIVLVCSLLLVLGNMVTAQENTKTIADKYGRTLNVGLGVGYYGYAGHSMPVLHADYEIDVAKNFTLAPFISFFSYRNDYYYNNNNSYYYHETVVPIGLKGSYYFDDLLKASANWDFYLAGSLGFAFRTTSWENGYNGDRNAYNGASPLFLDFHIGTEYHFNKKLGAFLDLSTGVSTVGLAIHSL